MRKVYPADNFVVGAGQWLVADSGTAKEVSDKLEITDGRSTTAVVLAVSGYFGRYSTNLWEWMRAKVSA